MRILHFSDLHICSENDQDFQDFILKPLLDDLRIQKQIRSFDIVLMTGDIVDKGATSFARRETCYETFCERVVNPIIDELSISRNRFFFVPGNHDIWRENDSKAIEIGLSGILQSIEEVNKHIDSGSEEGVKRILPFKNFEKNFYGNTDNCLLTNYHSLFIVPTNSIRIGIACLNSVWRSFNNSTDRHNLIIGERQISAARNYFKDCDIKIALIHHPLDWLSDFDRKCVEPMIENTFNLIFCGHIHSGSSWVKSDIYNGLFVSIAPSNWNYGIRNSNGDFCNGYSVIDFDTNSLRDIQVMHRRYSYRKNAYVPNNDLGNDFGITNLELPSTKELQLRYYENDLATTIRNSYFNELNEHLLTYNTNTKAPQELQDLFVFPRIVDKIQLNRDKKENEEL